MAAVLDVSSLTPFQLRAAIAAAELAGEIERECCARGAKRNGTMELHVMRNGREFQKSFRRSYGSTIYTEELGFE